MPDQILVPESVLREKVTAALKGAGADDDSAAGCTRALLYASRMGFDSHGVRLTAHYVAMLRAGRINPRPNRRVRRTGPSTAMIDADDGLGHAATYAAMDLACGLARESGIGAVGVFRSSHFGAGGAYAVAGADSGYLALVTTNTDSVVAPHGGSRAFHGTNPLAVAAPVTGRRPWLLEMATSSMPYNRVVLARAAGVPLPAGVAADGQGNPTVDPAEAQMLLPLGGIDFGYKGAGLAGLVTIFSAALTGGTLDPDMIPMFQTQNFHTPRNLGHFCLALDPERFVGRAAYDRAMGRYLTRLRAVRPRPGERVLAPGDREWETEANRARAGIPVDSTTAKFLSVDGAARCP
ncbi:MAG TPA: Ldh family oxidoreductase [Xanthobacteraceae bacterium]|nr:Ldh family oxidoreductase [Xanthobacteraceae bacterium]